MEVIGIAGLPQSKAIPAPGVFAEQATFCCLQVPVPVEPAHAPPFHPLGTE